jgi:hypothetical protein
MLTFAFGVITAGYLIAGVFFAKFWSRTRDPLFAAFAVAFWLLAFNQGLVALIGGAREDQAWLYLPRLAAFTLIVVAVVQKNMRRRSLGG